MSIDNKGVSDPSSSKSKPSLRVKPKLTREVWPKWIKDAIREELGDCIHNIRNLTQERANVFLEKYNLQVRGFRKLKHVIYNMGRTPR